MPANTDPNLLWLGVALGAVIMIAQAWPKVLGPIGEAFREWARSKRAAEAESEDADWEDLKQERDYLRGVADERLREIRARDELIMAHAPWDWRMFEDAVRAGSSPEPPPPLIPHIPPPPPGVQG